jgi:hypothetical protein
LKKWDDIQNAICPSLFKEKSCSSVLYLGLNQSSWTNREVYGDIQNWFVVVKYAAIFPFAKHEMAVLAWISSS